MHLKSLSYVAALRIPGVADCATRDQGEAPQTTFRGPGASVKNGKSGPRRLKPASKGQMKMKCMVIVKASKDSEKGVMPSAELLAAMGKYNQELIKSGIMRGGGGLKPTSHGKRVRFSGAQRAVTHGPFAPTEEQISGYWLWEVKSMDEAVEWLKRCPNPMLVDSDIEIRPEYEAADFAK
jgi:hypothetical protein